MSKKSDAQITPDNFLDSYKPVSPQRRAGAISPETQTEQQPVETSKEACRETETRVLQGRGNGVAMTQQDYKRVFLRPNQGESMRYGKTYYVSKDDRKKIKALMLCFGEAGDRFPLSVFIHNLLEYHFSEFAGLISEMMGRQSISNPFNKTDE